MPSLPPPGPAALESAADPAVPDRYSDLGIIANRFGYVLGGLFIPDDPASRGALFFSALAMAAGLAAAPLAAAIRNPKSLLRAEYLLALAPIYWLLLDLLEGPYPMRGISPEQIQSAFMGIGLFCRRIMDQRFRPSSVESARCPC